PAARLAADRRRNRRRKHDLDCTKPVGVWAIYSEEPPLAPRELAYDDGAFQCVCPGGHNGMNDCEHKHRVEGSVAFVPSVFGMTMASVAVRWLAGSLADRSAVTRDHAGLQSGDVRRGDEAPAELDLLR